MTSSKTPIKHSTTHSTEVADIRLEDNNTPYSVTFDDIYFSKDNGLEESYYVFFQGNKLDTRWQRENFGLTQNESVFSIGETGFGTGLNFLMTWREWQQAREKAKINHTPKSIPRLHFYSTEKHPISKKALANALNAWPELSALSAQLLNAYPPQPHNGMIRFVFEEGQVCLNIYFGDATAGFEHLLPCKLPNAKIESLIHLAQKDFQATLLPRIHAWYFDGFAPAKNPSMWQAPLFEAAAKLSYTHTTFATFTAAGDVRRLLQGIGFICEKRKGFGRKREMLVGNYLASHNEAAQNVDEKIKANHGAVSQDHDSWHTCDTHITPIKHCVIIGGGLAGCHTAYALALRGIKSTIIEKNPQLAAEASGNKQGIVYAKLSPHRSPAEGPLSYFNFYAFLFANSFYQSHNFYQATGKQCGVLQLATNDQQLELYEEFINDFEESWPFEWLTPKECSLKAGVKIQHKGLFINNAGWVSPPLLCKALTQHSNITLQCDTKVESIHTLETEHTIHLSNKSKITCDAIVFANAHEALRFDYCKRLPLKSIRGQVTHLDTSESTQKLKCVICGDGYVAPLFDNECTTGASFNLTDTSIDINTRDHQHNVEKLHALSPEFSREYPLEKTATLEGRVGFRCTTPDYFPIAGPIPDDSMMIERFKHYTKKANAHIENTGSFHPNVYALLGLGSRGLTYAPLAAEIIASQMCREFSPIEQDIIRHLHPARFLIRDLKRNKVHLG